MFPIQGALRQPGDRWMIRGPLEYVPSVELEVVNKQKAIPLDENEGIYVRDIKTGKVHVYYSRLTLHVGWYWHIHQSSTYKWFLTSKCCSSKPF